MMNPAHLSVPGHTAVPLFFPPPQLDLGDLRQQLAHSQTLFPDNPSVWFKDLAGYLNLYLTAPDTGPTLSSHTHGGSGALARRGPSPGL